MPQPIRGRITRFLVLAAAVLLLPVLSACATSYGASTQAPYSASNGAKADTGELHLRGILAVAEDSGRATLVATVVNDGGKDEIVGIDVRNGQARLAPSPLPLPGHEVTRIGTKGHEPLAIVLTGDSVDLGLTVHLTFHFEHSASVSVDALVLAREGAYATVPVPGSPS